MRSWQKGLGQKPGGLDQKAWAREAEPEGLGQRAELGAGPEGKRVWDRGIRPGGLGQRA